MDVRVVCISRAIAAEGETIGEIVARRLGFRYLDDQIITRAARLAQVDPALLATAEQRQPLLRRLLDNLPSARGLAGALTAATGVPVESFVGPAPVRVVSEEMRTLIRAAIHEVARAGEAVIVAHAASMALAGREGILRVLVTAPVEVRAGRLTATQRLSGAAAEAAVASSDLARRDYLKRFYAVTEELPTHYDLVINTEVLSAEEAAAAVIAAARTP